MYPAAFDYHRPTSLQDALALLSAQPEAKLLAGGHSLIPLMKQRLAEPAALIDLRDVPGMAGVRRENGLIAIGAMTSYWQILTSADVNAAMPVLAEVAGGIGDPQVRNRGTIGGSLVHADPGNDFPAIALAADAQLVCAGMEGERVVPAGEWFVSLMTTALGDDEILREIRFPVPSGAWGAAYVKMPDPASRMAMVGVAALVALAPDGTCRSVGIGVTGVTAVPVRAASVERALTGQRLDEAGIARALEALADDVEIEPSRLAAVADRAHLCEVAAGRALRRAHERAAGSGTPA